MQQVSFLKNAIENVVYTMAGPFVSRPQASRVSGIIASHDGFLLLLSPAVICNQDIAYMG